MHTDGPRTSSWMPVQYQSTISYTPWQGWCGWYRWCGWCGDNLLWCMPLPLLRLLLLVTFLLLLWLFTHWKLYEMEYKTACTPTPIAHNYWEMNFSKSKMAVTITVILFYLLYSITWRKFQRKDAYKSRKKSGMTYCWLWRSGDQLDVENVQNAKWTQRD